MNLPLRLCLAACLLSLSACGGGGGSGAGAATTASSAGSSSSSGGGSSSSSGGSRASPQNACFTTLAAPGTDAPRVVVADIDSGINAYHAYFRAGSSIYTGSAPSAVTPSVLAAFGINADHIITLTRTGNFASDFATDLPKLRAVKTGEPYWFSGTNIIAVSFTPGTTPLLPDNESDTHGTGTAASVLAANPEAIVLFIEGTGSTGEAYAFTHPMVDIVTTSYGTPGSAPSGALNKSYTGVYCNGKLHFGASDNSPAASTGDGTSGPWWSIGISGWEEGSSEGRQALSGNFVDFVADFTQALPYCMACEDARTQSVSGTSFATPLSAGIAAKVLLAARRARGYNGGITPAGAQPAMVDGSSPLTNWQLRRALEQAAYVPTASEYKPTQGAIEQSTPVNDSAPYLTVAWGLLSAIPSKQVVAETLARLGISGTANRDKPAATCSYQTQQMANRKRTWNNDPTSDSFANPATPDPLISCQ